MLHSLNDLKRFSLDATDDTMGSVKDLYFDDSDWSVRYLVANSGFWFFGRDVLISVESLGKPDLERGTIPVALSRKQIRELPPADSQPPVSEQERGEPGMSRWPSFAVTGDGTPSFPPFIPVAGFGPVVVAGREEAARPQEDIPQGDPHLRSAVELEGYAIAATDGDIGKVRDVIIDRESWRIRYLAVDTGGWFTGHEVVLSVDWIRRISYPERQVVVGVTRDAIEKSPPLRSLSDLRRSYEEELYRAYGYPAYWV
jgi:uncharacterized protein YrrD